MLGDAHSLQEYAHHPRYARDSTKAPPAPRPSAVHTTLEFSTATVVTEGLSTDAIMLLRCVGTVLDTSGEMINLDLSISAGPGYEASADHNGIEGSFGKLNLKAGSSADVRFCFLNSATGQPFTLKEFVFTMYDLEAADNGAVAASVTALGFEKFILGVDSEIGVSVGAGETVEAEDRRTTFTGE